MAKKKINMLGIIPKLTQEEKVIMVRMWNFTLHRRAPSPFEPFRNYFKEIETDLMFKDADKICATAYEYAKTSPRRPGERELAKKLKRLINEQRSNSSSPAEADQEPAPRDPHDDLSSSSRKELSEHYEYLMVRCNKRSSGV